MTNADEQLARIGFARPWRETVCWRAVRLEPAAPAQQPAASEPDPACSRALARWRDLLAHGSRPSPYRISRVDSPRSTRKA